MGPHCEGRCETVRAEQESLRPKPWDLVVSVEEMPTTADLFHRQKAAFMGLRIQTFKILSGFCLPLPLPFFIQCVFLAPAEYTRPGLVLGFVFLSPAHPSSWFHLSVPLL